MSADDPSASDFAVAVVGMAGRFPGASDVDAFWRNLREGKESITFFSDDELLARGVRPATMAAPGFVKASAVLDDIARFDAALFGYPPREAELLDPQHRILLECGWAALEHAGYDSTRYPGSIGVFAGTSISSYLLFNLMTYPEMASSGDEFSLMVANDKDFAATRLAYHLNLRGPGVDVQTGCSTSLVAVHLACQTLLGFQCDMALAGGVSVHVPQRAGYLHQEGGITSPDGHCRAFDERGRGTIFGSGVGLVVLKRLEDALAERDTIYAVIKGSAINNDGAVKVGFTAPGVAGQAEVIARAHAMAGVSPDTIGYVEAHGTATQLGDPVEVAALTQAFAAGTRRGQFCALGSAKTNIGHLDTAAGIAGLIKTIQALRHRELPPSLHFERPNPQIDFASSPFYVNTALAPWPEGPAPRRAGVSSFGIGGTNAHVVLEQAPSVRARGGARPWQILPLSAKTETALDALTAALSAHLGEQSAPLREPPAPLREPAAQELADVAFTLQQGRRALERRRFVVARDRSEAIRGLNDPDARSTLTAVRPTRTPSLAFMFAGSDAVHSNMGRGLYASEPAFRHHVDRCSAIVERLLGVDLRDLMYPSTSGEEDAARRLMRPSLGQSALFAVQSATAELWRARGIRPEAVIGHSVGEYAAAWASGVVSLEDVVSLVVRRGQLFEHLPQGSMLGVPLSEDEARAMAGDRLCVAAINGPGHTVLAGSTEAVEAMMADLERREIEFRHIQVNVAFHSRLVEPVLERFHELAAAVAWSPPAMLCVSTVTGTWLTPAEATDPAYWVRHLRNTVRFADGVQLLLEDPHRLLLEVGPGRTLTALAKLTARGPRARTVLASMRHPLDQADDEEIFARATGKLWLAGFDLDWSAVHEGESPGRVPLPTYPFEGRKHWIAPQEPSLALRRTGRPDKHPNVSDWFYQPSWQHRRLAPPSRTEREAPARKWMVLLDQRGLGERLAERLAAAGCVVVRAEHASDIQTLPEALSGVVDLRAVAPVGSDDFEAAQREAGDRVRLARLLGERSPASMQLVVVGHRAVGVGGGDAIAPARAAAMAVCNVLPQEIAGLACRYVDVELLEDGPALARLADALACEIESGSEPVVALRAGHRWVQGYVPFPLPRDAAAGRSLRHGGVYLITGGTGKVGLHVAHYLARKVGAKLVLVARRPLRDAVSALELAGAEVVVERADVGDATQMRAIVEGTLARFGALHGVVHAAGVAGEAAIHLASDLEAAHFAAQFQAKVRGTETLDRVLSGRELDFRLLVSSNAAVLGGVGLAAYAAANAYLDAFAMARTERPDERWISANWDAWPAPEGERLLQTRLDRFAMTAEESEDALERVLVAAPPGQIVIATGDLDARRAESAPCAAPGAAAEEGASAGPDLETVFAPAGNDLERSIARAWQQVLGVERIGVDDNFFDLGGNSLSWLKVVGHLKEELGVDVPLTSVFEAPSVAALAVLLGRAHPISATYEDSHARGTARRERRPKDRGSP
ncbi:SDR family NAD(P)-dependent oxidoreductase [Pendulispora albinea]|uniref:SDR family NAD(P)-dependent oxidoreductase n=1 Tax=Pendulispora albinea TaxID=2741071 RepID=A0ABZ2LUC7_9BACT